MKLYSIFVYLLAFLFLGLMLSTVIDESTGYDLKLEKPCVDERGNKFVDEICIDKVHCGIFGQVIDKRCSQELDKEQEEDDDPIN